jgi:serine/threonine protein kinase
VCRDIKTENVLLDEDWRPVLADYGFARKVDTKRNMTIVGTDEFMAPEVIWGDPYDERADVFSFGGVRAELFSGKRAGEDGFLVRTPRGKFKLDEEQVKAALAEGSPDAPERLAELVLQCLAYEPDDRCASTDALEVLGEILEEWKEDHPDDETAFDVCGVRRPSVIARDGAKEGCAPAGAMAAGDVSPSAVAPPSGAASPSTAEAAAMAAAAMAASSTIPAAAAAASASSTDIAADHG